MCVLSHFSHVQLCDPMDCSQAPPSMGFSRQEYWRGLPCPPPGNLSNPGIEPTSLMSPALIGGFFTISATWEALLYIYTNSPPRGYTQIHRSCTRHHTIQPARTATHHGVSGVPTWQTAQCWLDTYSQTQVCTDARRPPPLVQLCTQAYKCMDT